MASLKKNFFYSIFLTTSSYLMSLVVFPYVSRVLGPASLGLVGLTDGAVGCFTLLATMGINSLGIREIAKYRNDREKLSDIYSNLFSLSLVFTAIGVAGFIITGLLVPNLRQYPGLIIFGTLSIAAQVCVIEWFYKGMENFRYITVRGVIVKLCYIIAVFLLIKNPADYLIYFALVVATYAVNAIINIIYSRRFARFSLKGLQLRTWVKPFLFLGSYTILGALYTTFDQLFLGIVTTDTEVGYYAVSVKVFTIILGVFTALTSVLMPRMSAMIANKQRDAFISDTTRTIDTFVIFAIPLTILGIAYSPQIVLLIAGGAYQDAILPMQILMPLIFLIGYEQILIVQILTPLNCDRIILRNSLLVALIVIILNFCIVSRLGAIGSALIWTSGETFLLIISQIYSSRLTGISFPYKKLISTAVICAPGISIIIALRIIMENIWIEAIAGIISFLIVYIFIQIYIVRNKTFLLFIDAILPKRKEISER